MTTPRSESNHHLWRNRRTWWTAFTVLSNGHRQERVRRSLGTRDVIEARRRRDAMMREYASRPGTSLSVRGGVPAPIDWRHGHIDRIDHTIRALLAERIRMTVEIGAADGAYQGERGAFSEEAALTLLGPSAKLAPCRTLDDVFEAVSTGRASSAIVPIENTVAGPVPRCQELIDRHRMRVIGECRVHVVQTLVALPGASLDGVRRALSHPVALKQCSRFFAQHRQITPVPTWDTAGAVMEVVKERDSATAAIASRHAAAVHGGQVLADQIQDVADNFTRFLLLRP